MQRLPVRPLQRQGTAKPIVTHEDPCSVAGQGSVSPRVIESKPQHEPPSSLAVIIPARDASATLGACLRAILANSHQPDEIIVVNDASVDDTVAVARAACPDVVLVNHTAATGAAGARNAGAAVAKSEILLFIDADTQPRPDVVGRIAARIVQCDAVCGVYDAEPANTGFAARYKALFDSYQFSRLGLAPYDGFSAYCGAVRATAFAAVGGFDERLGHGLECENEEFGYRLSAHHKTLIDPTIAVQHRFPGLVRGTRNYFVRVRQWVELFCRRKRFETAGDATSGGAVAVLSGALVLGLAAVALFVPQPPLALIVALIGAVSLWLGANAGLMVYVARRSAGFVPMMTLLNLYFSAVITTGAVVGLIRGTLMTELPTARSEGTDDDAG
ncbi:MAG: glycosyltransferase [Myxococcales bacterium]|nr:glycosyltransferase [Myxococcales bacterium]